MKKPLQVLSAILLLIVLLFSGSCTQQPTQKINMDRVYAWCIVPFDNQHRTPEQRIEMLKTLGLKSYAYDWRVDQIPEMTQEWQLAKQNGINVSAVWMWIDAQTDTIDKLSEANEKVLQLLKENDMNTQLWMSFHPNYLEGLSDTDAVKKGAAMIEYLSKRLDDINCKLALYNHGDWFGEPANQIKIIKSLPDQEIGLIYNFHHGHEQIDQFPELVDIILPYLWAVNINGMRKEGPMILPIGQGDYEKEMVQLLIDKGYSGPWGVLGHIEDADVKIILENNLKGLKKLMN